MTISRIPSATAPADAPIPNSGETMYQFQENNLDNKFGSEEKP